MKDIKSIVANNLGVLRKQRGITQAELAEKLNYSDKAISKWERGDGLPDAYVLKKMGEIFGVSVDYMLSPHSEQNKKVETQPIKKTKRIINNIVSAGVLTLALLFFVIYAIKTDVYYWQVFVYVLPVLSITRIVFVSVWEKARGVFVYSSVLLWSLLATIYFAIANYNLWIIFVLGIPLQAIVFLAFRIKITIKVSKKPKKEKQEKKETQD